MESSILPSSSRPEGSARTLWNKIFTATSTNLTHHESLLFSIFLVLFLFTLIRLDAFIIICKARQTLNSTIFSLYNFKNLAWTMNLYYDFLFVPFQLVTIIWFEHFTGTIFFTLLRFFHFAINLKQVIQPEIPENSLVRKQLSRIYWPDYAWFYLLFNTSLCYLLGNLLYTNCFGNNSSSSNSPQPATPPIAFSNPIVSILIVTFIIFFIIRLYTCAVLSNVKETLESMGVYKEHLLERSGANLIWVSNLKYDLVISFIEWFPIPFTGFFHTTIFFTILRFVHLAVNLKQVMNPELPDDTWLREQYSGLYSPFYVNLHLFFNVLLSCLLPVYIFQL